MGFAEDKFYEYLRKETDIHSKIKVKEMLTHMPGVFSDATIQELHAKVTSDGDPSVVYHFLYNLQMRDDWVNCLLKALWDCDKKDLYVPLREKYKKLRPTKPIYSPRGSPPSPSFSHPTPWSNNNRPAQPDSSSRCNSLPPPMIPKDPESEPSPSGALSLNQFQPQLEPQEHGSPPMHYKRPTPNVVPSARASVTPQVLPPDEMDNVTPDDNIVKKPIPESKSLQSPPSVKKAGVSIAAPNPPEQRLPTSYSLPAKKDTDAALRFKEKSENHEGVSSPLADYHPPAKETVMEPKLVHPVQGSPRKQPPISPMNNRHNDHKDLVEPLQQVLPGCESAGGSVKGAPDSPVNSRHDIKDAYAGPHQRKVPGSQPATGSPIKVLPDLSGNSRHDVNNAHGGTHQGELPGPQPSSSSCRPLNSELLFSKPDVLRSVPGAGNIIGEEDETSDLSQIVLQISVPSESPQVSEIAQQPNSRLSQASANNGNLTPGTKPSTSTLRKSGSPSRRPEENDEPGDYSSLSSEPEENSYHTVSGSSPYVLHYREEAPAEDMGANNVPRRRFVTTSDAKETSDREEHSGSSLRNNLKNPAVIVLGATVVCLTLYIVWLKRKL